MEQELILCSIQSTLVTALLVPPALALASGIAFDSEAAVVMSLPIESHGFETVSFGQPVIILLAAPSPGLVTPTARSAPR